MSNLHVGSIYTTTVKAEVVAEVDVLIAGGGTAGCVAAIAAARQGVKVMLIERYGDLGGMMTTGNAGLTKYVVHENDQAVYREVIKELDDNPSSVQVVGGIPLEITSRLMDNGAGIGTCKQAGSYVFTDQERFKLLLLEIMEEEGVELLLHSMIVDVVMEGATIRGVVVENKSGRQVVLADQVIDATGDGDVACRAGAPYHVGVGPDDLAAQSGTPLQTMQVMGVMFRMGNVDMSTCFDYLKAHRDKVAVQPFALMTLSEAVESFEKGDMMTIMIYCEDHWLQVYNTPLNGVFTLCCPPFAGSGLSVEDLTKGEIALKKEVWRRIDVMRTSLPGFADAHLIDCPGIRVRETRHIHGEYMLTIEDIYNMREFPDSIGRGGHPIDITPIPDSLKKARLPHRWYFSIPFRTLVPKMVENLLLAGRCISNTHEASGCTRVTVQCMTTGEAAGTAAAMCILEKVKPRKLDVAKLRGRLKDRGVVL